MGITESQKQHAQDIQISAAHDPKSQVRLVAGPGTGKSSCIEEKVLHLLKQGVDASTIAAISFTRAAANDLRSRISIYCGSKGHPEAADVRVSTLHSLAMSYLKRAGQLNQYPVPPLVLDDWELEHIFDKEFGKTSGTTKKSRCEDIRKNLEAFWTTDEWDPPNYIQPKTEITEAEKKAFTAFHKQRSQLYACVLPGEVIRQCVKTTEAGTLSPMDLIEIRHLIVDEFQDLNPMDLIFVNNLAAAGAKFFVAGDDDQSIYSFRFGSPHGIQTFIDHFPQCGQHALTHCFRCAPNIVKSATNLIENFAAPNRIQKTLASLYASADPPVAGVVHRLKFKSEKAEAKYIAEACHKLISNGIRPREIFILLSNRKLGSDLLKALEKVEVPCEPPKSEGFLDTDAGRMVLALLRIACERSDNDDDNASDDYVAHRVLLGVLPNVGVGTCAKIADTVINKGLNYRDVFHRETTTGIFDARCSSALNRAKEYVQIASQWKDSDTIELRRQEISDVLAKEFSGSAASNTWNDAVMGFPEDMSLREVQLFLRADTDEQQLSVLNEVYTRLALAPPENLLPPKVRMMTMHGAKGLSGQIVFIPGLEESFLPGAKKTQYPGLILESARMLYVSITRARAACFLSYAKTRMVNGNRQNQIPCRFNDSLDGTFFEKTELSEDEMQLVLTMCQNL